jgi:hypothetical protein
VGRAEAGAEFSQDACEGFTRTGGAAGVDEREEADRGGKERPPALECWPPECGATADPYERVLLERELCAVLDLRFRIRLDPMPFPRTDAALVVGPD